MTRFDEVDANKLGRVIRKSVLVSSLLGTSPQAVVWDPAECCEITFDAIANWTFVLTLTPGHTPVHGETLRINYVARAAPVVRANVLFDLEAFLGVDTAKRWLNAEYANGYLRYVEYSTGAEWRWYPDNARSVETDAALVVSSVGPIASLEYSGSGSDHIEGPIHAFENEYYGRYLVAGFNVSDAVTYLMEEGYATPLVRRQGAGDGLNMKWINNFMGRGLGVVWAAGTPASGTLANLAAVSTNGGSTWTAVTNLPAALQAWMVSAEDASTASVLLMLSTEWRIYRTVDGGANWTLNGTMAGISQVITAMSHGGTGGLNTEAIVVTDNGAAHFVAPTDTGAPVRTYLIGATSTAFRCCAYTYSSTGSVIGALACGDSGQVWFEDVDYDQGSGWYDVSGGIGTNYDFVSVVTARDFFHALVRDADGTIYYTASRTQGRHWTRPARLPGFDGNTPVIRGALVKGLDTLYFNLSPDLNNAGDQTFLYRAHRPSHLNV